MTAKRRQEPEFLKGHSTHRRTEGDYMGMLLETVTLEDWKEVVTSALQAAKNGDATARAWLAQYLVGKPQHNAPTPLNVVVQQLNGTDPIVEKLATPIIQRAKYPSLHTKEAWEDGVHDLIANEVARKVPDPMLR